MKVRRWVMALQGTPPRVGPWRPYGECCEVAILHDGIAVRAWADGSVEDEAIRIASARVKRALVLHGTEEG